MSYDETQYTHHQWILVLWNLYYLVIICDLFVSLEKYYTISLGIILLNQTRCSLFALLTLW